MIRALSCISAISIAMQLAAFDLNVNIQHAVCGATTGSIWVAPSGGVAPYTYVWSTGENTASIFDVAPGIYNVTVTDSDGVIETEEIELLELDVLFPPFAATAYACAPGCDGSLNMNLPLGGSTTYTVVFDPPGPQGGASPNGIYFNSFCLGTEYTATVTNSEGCSGVIGPITVIGPIQSELISATVTGSCPGGATGSATLVFDPIPSGIGVFGPGLEGFFSNGSTYTFTNLAPGTYSGHAITPDDQVICEAPYSFVIPESTEPCGLLSGTAFADVDGDCTQGADEVGVPNKIFSVEPGGHLLITDGSGNFSTEFPYGTFALNTTFSDYSSDCVTLPYDFTLDGGNVSEILVLPLDPQFGPDVAVYVTAGTHVPGFAVTYHVSISNQGPFIFDDLSLDLMFDPILEIGTAEGSPVLLVPGHYQWTGLDLAAYESIQFAVDFIVPADAGLLGTVVLGTAAVSGNLDDAEEANDTYTRSSTIVGAFDPNDKLVNTSSQTSGSQYFLDLDDHVDYTIRFQNTGTASAINVHLIDTISEDLDLLSLEILGSSHSFTPSILPGRVLRFDFPGIMLPDSSADLLGSQGYVSFRLKPIDDIQMGDELVNAADIFFDFNEPIRTNDAVLVVDMSTGINSAEYGQFMIFPNPATDRIQVRMIGASWNYEILSMDGRSLQSGRASADLADLSIAHLAAGQYMLRAVDQEGSVSVARFIKQ